MSDILRKGADFGAYNEDGASCDPASFEAVVRSRRSVRKFLPDPVPDDIVRRCLELALLAPNSSNLQTWSFHVVQDASARTAMNAACLSQPAATTAPLLIVCTVEPGRWRQHAAEMGNLLASGDPPAPQAALNYYRRLIPLAYSGGPLGLFHLVKKLAVALAGLKRATPRQPTSSCDISVVAHKSAALACENLMLALRAYGYDSCPMEGLDSSRVLGTLGLGSGHEVVMAISGGKRAPGGIYGPRIRFESSRFIRYV